MEARTLWELAQVNIARPLEPLDSPLLAEFMAALTPINALADAAPGFVWRLQTDDGDATAIPVFGSTELIVNMSVWRDLESLGQFVFKSGHVEVMRRRRSWFAPMTDAYTALWWVPAGVRPTVPEAENRLASLRSRGSTPYAFSFRSPFPAPSAPFEIVEQIRSDDETPAEISADWRCPV